MCTAFQRTREAGRSVAVDMGRSLFTQTSKCAKATITKLEPGAKSSALRLCTELEREQKT